MTLCACFTLYTVQYGSTVGCVVGPSLKPCYSKLCTLQAQSSAPSGGLHTYPCIVKQQSMLTLSKEQEGAAFGATVSTNTYLLCF